MSLLSGFSVVVILLFSCFFLEPTSSAAIGSSGLSYSSCNSNSIFQVRSLSVSPDPPRIGKPVTLKVEIESSEFITGGEVQVQVKGTGALSFFNPQPVTRDICPLLPTGCPIRKGLTTMTITKQIPSFAPAGTYEVEMKAYDNSGRSLLCADVTIQLTKGRRMFFFF